MLTVNARPYDFPFDPKHTALIMIDMQRDFIEDGGFGAAIGNDVSLLRAIIPTTQKLLALCRDKGITVIHTKECHDPDLSDCPPSKIKRGGSDLKIGDVGPMGRILVNGEIGSDFIPELAPVFGETVITKPGKGAFYATELPAILEESGITHLLFAGVTTEVCVQTTMREANDRGYECLLIEDATESYFPEYKKATIEMMIAQGGIVGWAAPLKDLAAAFN
jgi:nicotinamidase-related amidase